MSKYVAPRFRKNETAEDKEDKLVMLIKESSTTDFPVLGGGSHAKPVSNLSFATKALEWEKKRLDTEAKLREEEYLAARKAEQDAGLELFVGAPKPKTVKPAPRPVEIEAIPAPVSEWTTVYRKPRREKKEIVFDDDGEYNDNIDMDDYPSD
jgi:hypothetical protein